MLAVLEKHCRPDDVSPIADQIIFIDDNNSALRLYIWDKIFEDYRTQDSKPGCPPSLMLCNEIQKLGPSILFPDKKVGLRVEGALRIRHSCSQRQEQQT